MFEAKSKHPGFNHALRQEDGRWFWGGYKPDNHPPACMGRDAQHAAETVYQHFTGACDELGVLKLRDGAVLAELEPGKWVVTSAGGRVTVTLPEFEANYVSDIVAACSDAVLLASNARLCLQVRKDVAEMEHAARSLQAIGEQADIVGAEIKRHNGCVAIVGQRIVDMRGDPRTNANGYTLGVMHGMIDALNTIQPGYLTIEANAGGKTAPVPLRARLVNWWRSL